MALESALTILCDTLRTRLAVDVVLGPPDAAVPALYLWPWRLEEATSLANQRPPLRPGGPALVSATPLNIHFLVVAQPVYANDGLSRLARARQVLLEHPVLQAEGNPVQVVPSPLGVEQLTALFTAARLPLCLCVSGVLRGV